MKTAGIRKARQHLSVLLGEVRKGSEVVITDRGRPVARLVPPREDSARPYSSHRALRASIRMRGGPLARTIERARADRS